MVIPERSRPDLTPDEGATPAEGHRAYDDPTPAAKLRALIARAGLSQRGAARELEVAERTMRYWCAGEQPVPKMALLALERLIDVQRTVTDK